MIDFDTRLKKIIMKNSRKENFKNDIIDINEDSSLTSDFGFDSVQIIEMIVDLEAEFNTTIDDEDIDLEVLTKYGTLKELILKKINS